MDSYDELQAEVMSLRRALVSAENCLIRWIVGLVIFAALFGILMFVAGSQCEATRQVMGGLR